MTISKRVLAIATLIGLVALVPVLLAGASPVAAAPPSGATVVNHNTTFSQVFPDDICGPRANTTTFTRKMEQVKYSERADGSFVYRDVAVVTYVSDFVDPGLQDLTGRLTEVNQFVLTPGSTFVGTTTFHDFLGDIRIFVRSHFTVVDGRVVVDREVFQVTGCP